jgi:hypothetical protein
LLALGYTSIDIYALKRARRFISTGWGSVVVCGEEEWRREAGPEMRGSSMSRRVLVTARRKKKTAGRERSEMAAASLVLLSL